MIAAVAMRSREIGTLSNIIRRKHVDLDFALPWVSLPDIAVTDTLGAYSFEIEALVPQSAAEITDTSRLSTNIHDQVDIIGGSRWIGAMLRCEEPHHLATDQTPASRKRLCQVEENEPPLLLGR